MKLLDRFADWLSPRNETVAQDGTWLSDWFRGGESDSGESVNSRTAMQMAVVWQCVNWRAKMYGHLPHKVLENVVTMGKAATQEARNHPAWTLIHDSPNPTLTATAWHAMISADLHLDGNSYAWIQRGSNTGRIQHLWRFQPDKMRCEANKAENAIDYFARLPNGGEQKFLADEILHIRGLGYDGVRGYNPINMMREEIGWTLGTRRFSSKAYKNAFRPSGLLISPTAIKEPAKTNLINALKASGKDGGLAMIEGALEYKALQIAQKDMEFISTMEFQDERIAGIMEVHPHELGITRNLNNSISEQMTINSVTRNLLPFAVNVEHWMNLQLFSDAASSGRGGGTERERYFIQSNFNALMRGDTAAQTSHLIAMRDRGIYDGNQCAAYLGLPAFVGGETRVINAAYVPLDMLEELARKKATDPAPGAPNEPGAPKPSENEDKQALAAGLFAGMFRDAVGRTLKRAKDRERSIVAIFLPLLVAIGNLADSAPSLSVEDYLGAMGKRAVQWQEANAESIATEELNRAITALLGEV